MATLTEGIDTGSIHRAPLLREIGKLETTNAELQEVLSQVLSKWDSLPVGHHSPRTVQTWLIDSMGPAIADVRRVLKSEPT